MKLFASFLSKRGPPAFNDLPAADCGELGCGVGVTDGDREGPSLPKASHTQRVSLRFCSDRRAGMLHVFCRWIIEIVMIQSYQIRASREGGLREEAVSIMSSNTRS